MADNNIQIRISLTDDFTRNFNRAMRNVRRAQRTFQETAGGVNTASASLGNFSARLSAMGSPLGQLGGRLSNFSSGLAGLGVVAGTATIALAGLALGFTALVATMIVATKVGVPFERNMNILKAVTGATQVQFDKLRKSALDLGRSTKFTATEVSQLQVQLSKLGFTTTEVLQATKAVIDLATATGESLAEAATVTGSVLRAFGLDASEAGRLVDVMAGAFTSSALDLQKFRESMKFVAPVAASAGFAIEETTALLSKLADAGLSGGLAGRNLTKALGDMFKSGSKLKGLLGPMVVDFDSLIDRLVELDREGFGAAELGAAGLSAGLLKVIPTLVRSAKGLKEVRDNLVLADGAAQDMARTVTDDLKDSFDQITSRLEGIGLALFDTFKDDFREAIDGTVDTLDSLITFVKDNRSLISDMFQIAIAPILLVNSAINGVINTLEFLKALEGIDTLGGIKQAAKDALLFNTVGAELKVTIASFTNELEFNVAIIDRLKTSTTALTQEQLKEAKIAKVNIKEAKALIKINKERLQIKAFDIEATMAFNRAAKGISEKSQQLITFGIEPIDISDVTKELVKDGEKFSKQLDLGISGVSADIQKLRESILPILKEQEEGAKRLTDLSKAEAEAVALAARSREKLNAATKATELPKSSFEEFKRSSQSLDQLNKNLEKVQQKSIAVQNALADAQSQATSLALTRDQQFQTSIIDNEKRTVAEKIKATRKFFDTSNKLSKISVADDLRNDNAKLDSQKLLFEQKIAGAEAELITIRAARTKFDNETQTEELNAREETNNKIIETSRASMKTLSEERIQNARNTEFEIGTIRLEQARLINEQIAEIEKEALAKKIEAIQTGLAAIGQITNAASGLINEISSKEANEDAKKFAEKRKNLDKQLKSGAISQKKFDSEIEKLRSEEDKRALKRAKTQKKLQLISVILSTASGVARAFSDYPFPASAVVAGIVGGLGAAQAGVIASQAFQDGGIVQGVGRGDRVNTILEPGEGILNKRTTNQIGPGGINALNNQNQSSPAPINNITYSPTNNFSSDVADKSGLLQILAQDKQGFADFLNDEMVAKGYLSLG